MNILKTCNDEGHFCWWRLCNPYHFTVHPLQHPKFFFWPSFTLICKEQLYVWCWKGKQLEMIVEGVKMNNEKENGTINGHKEGCLDKNLLCYHVKVWFSYEIRYFCLSGWAHE